KTRSTSVRALGMRQAYARRLGVLPARLLVDHLLELGRDRPYLDGAVPGDRDLRGRGQGFVQVVQLEDEEAGKDLLGLGEGAVGRDRLAVAHADRRGLLGQLQRRTATDLVRDGGHE